MLWIRIEYPAILIPHSCPSFPSMSACRRAGCRLHVKTPTYTGSCVLQELLEISSRITPQAAPERGTCSTEEKPLFLGRQGYHYCKCLHSFILRLQSITPEHHPSSHLNLLNQHVLCSTGWLLHFHNLQSPKYCYQRPRVNSCRDGYSLALHNHIFSSAVSLKRKNMHKSPKHWWQWWPTCNSAPEDLQQPQGGCWGLRCGVTTVGGNLPGQELLKVTFK